MHDKTFDGNAVRYDLSLTLISFSHRLTCIFDVSQRHKIILINLMLNVYTHTKHT